MNNDIIGIPDKIVVMTEAEMVLDAYNAGLQSLNGSLALINESLHPLGFKIFGEVKQGMDHFGHAYTLLLEFLAEENK